VLNNFRKHTALLSKVNAHAANGFSNFYLWLNFISKYSLKAMATKNEVAKEVSCSIFWIYLFIYGSRHFAF